MSTIDPTTVRMLRWFAAATIAGAILGAIGPFGSYLNHGAALRFGYWIGAMWLGLVLYGAGVMLAGRIAPPGSRAHWPALILAALIATVPEAWLTRIVAFRLWPELDGIGLTWLGWYAQNATIGIIATIGGVLIARRWPAAGTASGTPVGRATVPALPHGDILALQMEDHYVRVHTNRGSELVLMPLGRAIDAARIDGLRIHRSWWVANHAVAAVEGTPRAMRLHLTNGITAPVARSAVASLRAAGWLTA